MTTAKVNILLVDDRPDRLTSYEAALESLGHNLVRAQSGEEALWKLMEKRDYAAILLDVSMPDLSGFETAALIRNHHRFLEIPIVFVTGVRITYLDQLKGYQMGAVDYVQIPVVPEILRGKIQALVQLYLQRAELSRLNTELASSNAKLAEAHEQLKAEKMQELYQLNQNLEQANNKLLAINILLNDEIAERKRAEEELSKASRRKDEYIAILAHELRNPLSAIYNSIQVLQLDSATPEQISWAQELLQRQMNHLTRLLDDLLDVSRISNGKIQLRLEPVDLIDVIQQAVDTVKPMLATHQHELKLELAHQQIFIKGDIARLNQVIVNLLTNAIKYMGDGGLIELMLEMRENNRAAIRVKDHGVGIPPELFERIFDLFVQAPDNHSHAQGGLGIGLALARTLVELHGGTIEVHSNGSNCGAEFTVLLPVVGATADATVDGNADAPVVSNPLHILIVDDNVDSACALAICLQNWGHQLEVRHTGMDGLNAAQQNPPDIVLLDIGLPDIDGYEVALKLRESLGDTPLQIIALTGYGAETQKSRALSQGFNHYLIKPVDHSQLLDLLNKTAQEAVVE